MAQIVSRIILLSKAYLKTKSTEGFRMKSELTVVFFQRLLRMNNQLFGKTQIVKDVLLAALDFTQVEQCDSLAQLRSVEKQWAKNSGLLVGKSQKAVSFQNRVSMRIHELEEIEEANQQVVAAEPCNPNVEMSNQHGANDDADSDEEDDGSGDTLAHEDLDRYWQEHVDGAFIDRGHYDDRELLQMQQVWLDQLRQAGLTGSARKRGHNDSAQKSILKSPTDFKMRLGEVEAASSAKSKQSEAQPRTRRGRRGAPGIQSATAQTLGRVTALQPIEEAKNGSGSAGQKRRVRIVESGRPQRAATATKGTVKSEISEYDSEEEESSSEQPSESESNFQSSSRHQQSASKDIQAKQESSSPSLEQHELLVSDNLGVFAKNAAKSFARNSKRLSDGTAPRKSAEKIHVGLPASARNQQDGSAQMQSPVAKDRAGDDKLSEASSAKRGLIRDFDLVEKASDAGRPKGAGVMTRRAKRSQNTSRAMSESSQADEDSDADGGMFDFADGKLTKQIKQQKKLKAAAAKQSAAAAKAEKTAKGASAGQAKAAPTVSRSTRSRTRQSKQ